jgi:hypothetical protein
LRAIAVDDARRQVQRVAREVGPQSRDRPAQRVQTERRQRQRELIDELVDRVRQDIVGC